jgi:hypothetical protein
MNATARIEQHDIELACEPLLSCGSLLMASLVTNGDGFAVELGRRPVMADGVRPAFKPLRLDLEALPRVRRLADAASGQLPGMVVTFGEMLMLAEDGDLGAAVSCERGCSPWFSLVQGDGDGVVAMPVREADTLVQVIRNAERELVDRGLASLDLGAAH